MRFRTSPAIFAVLLNPKATTHALKASPHPFHDVDNSGKLSPPIYIRGDESFHYEEDEDGYTLIQDPTYTQTRGRRKRVYAKLRDGELVSSGIVFSADAFKRNKNRLNGLAKHLKPPEQARRSQCGPYCESGAHNNTIGTPSLPIDNRRNQQEHMNRRRLISNHTSLANLALLIRFADHQNRILPQPSQYKILLNGPAGPGTIAPTGSVNDVFTANSYGKFQLNSTVTSWVTVSREEAYYADGKSGLGPRIFEAIREALDIVDTEQSINLDEFNTDYDNGDLYIDSITIFHSGYGAEWGGTDCYGTPESQRIWSHNWFLYNGPWQSSSGRVRVSSYNINPGMWDVCGSQISRIGVVAHEASHFLGLPDLYDPSGGAGVGIYDLMSDSWGADHSQLYPPLMSPWSKIYLGWLTPTLLTGKGDRSLRQSWEYPDAYILSDGFQPQEYILIENRQPGSFDALLPLGGLAIWHIDEVMAQEANSNEGYPGQAGWPANNRHYHVALLQADGRYDLERGINSGDFNDFFRNDFFGGIDFLFPSYDDPSFGPFPNTDSYGQGVVAKTNHYISGISAPGEVMTFSVLTSSPCERGEVYFDLLLLTDGKGYEIAWMLRDTITDVTLLSGDGYLSYTQISIAQCIPANCYTFVITDSGGDGLCCDQGYGGYSVRLNGLKLAAGNAFGNKVEVDLQCLLTPTASPTHEPTYNPSKSPTTSPTITQLPSVFPSNTPLSTPSSNPSDLAGMFPSKPDCSVDEIFVEVITEAHTTTKAGAWHIRDIHGTTVMESPTSNDGGHHTTQSCLDQNTCYIFILNNSEANISLENASNDGLFTIKISDHVVSFGRNFHVDHQMMFGDACLDFNSTCLHNGNVQDALFVLELAGDTMSQNISWELIDSDDNTVHSAGPFAECDVNSFAACIPLDECYRFIAANNATNTSGPAGVYTLLLLLDAGGSIQNYTGDFSQTRTQVSLGTC